MDRKNELEPVGQKEQRKTGETEMKNEMCFREDNRCVCV